MINEKIEELNFSSFNILQKLFGQIILNDILLYISTNFKIIKLLCY